MYLRLLGGLQLTDDRGEDVTPPAGLPAQLLAIVALHGPVGWERVAEWLWPEDDPQRVPVRLRNVRARLNKSSGEVLVADGGAMRVGPRVAVDWTAFEAAATEARRSVGREAAVRTARRAVELYRGELLPADRYTRWSEAPRDRLRRHFLALVDLLAGDEPAVPVAEAVLLLDRATVESPLDEVWWARLARLLARQGQRGSALRAAERGRRYLAEAGLATVELDELVAEVRA